MDTPRYLDLFVSEAREHVSAINRQLLRLEGGAEGSAPVEEIFRSVHTLKGMAGAMGFARAASLAHALEHILEQLRSGSLAADAEMTDALFQAVDALETSIEREVAGQAGGGEPVLERLQEIGPAEGAGTAAGGEAGARAAATNDGAVDLQGPGRVQKVTVMISASAALPAVRALLALRNARELGALGAIEPTEERLNAGDFGGSVGFLIRTDRDPEEIQSAIVAAGDVAHVLVEEVEEAARPARGAGGRRSAGGARGAVVRVSEERLDVLVDRVGELVIARDSLRRLATIRGDEELEESAEGFSRLIAELRDEVMDLRLVPIGDVFDRFPRLVRDSARTLGKRVSLEVTGRDVELDRSLLNELGDLLVHLIRNAVDHGLEAPEERVAAGKPETGEVRLAATREGSRVVVSVEDDGRGIQRELVTAAAIRSGLITESAAAALTDDELFAFLARPGFSTAARVTDVSGRGVGLDAVATRLRALGGAMEVRSESGRGSSFKLELPLSLAIVRSLEVEVAGEPYLVPIGGIREVAEVLDTIPPSDGAPERIALRDEEVPVLRLSSVLAAGTPDPARGPQPVVVVLPGDRPLGLIVDALVGQHESVLKPFDAVAGMLPFFSGAALLADGRPSLVLDIHRVAALADHARQGELTSTVETTC